MRSKVRTRLILTVSVLAILPLAASYFLISEVLDPALNIAFHPAIGEALDVSQTNLKTLKQLNPEQQGDYKNQFQEIQNLKTVYTDASLVRESLNKTLITYYIGGFSLVLLIAVLSASFLSRSISKCYQLTFNELLEERERVTYLKDISMWQSVAKKLAHEIKNPLTPIQMMLTDLPKSYDRQSPQEFKNYLQQVHEIVSEEVSHLKHMVGSFSTFAKLPDKQAKQTQLSPFLENYCKNYDASWPSVKLIYRDFTGGGSHRVMLDQGQFRQVFANIVNNAVEANPHVSMNIQFILLSTPTHYTIQIVNDGAPINEETRERVFNVYFSTKKKGTNMGLGLAIARKIIMEHQGDVRCMDLEEGAGFSISIPKLRKGENDDVYQKI